jgi:hypothetical protein
VIKSPQRSICTTPLSVDAGKPCGFMPHGYGPFEQGNGRCGVETTSQSREVFIALASLIRAGRHEMALAILDNELGGGC